MAKSTHGGDQTDVDRLVETARAEAANIRKATRSPNSPEFPRIPGYTIEAELHRGAQGIVYRAEDAHGQAVAIKVLGGRHAISANDRLRFEREVRLLHELDHPGIVPVLEHGSTEDFLFFVMPLVKGKPLDVALTTKGISISDRVELFIQIAGALEAAHRVGVIHRDLKPSNILVDDAGQAHLIDFGLAGSLRTSGESAASLTKSGQFIGSLPWASPEHGGGQSVRIDTRSDVYSLGVILYQSLVGVFPYSIDGGPLEILERIRGEPPESLRSIDPAIPRDLETITLTALRKEPERRYQSVGQFRNDLRRWISGEAIEARRDSIWSLLRHAARRHRLATAGAAACLIAGMMLGGGMVFRYQQAVQAERQAVARADRQEDEIRSLKRELARLTERVRKPASWRSAFRTADELRKMSPAEGWAFIERTWPTLETVHAKQQFLKAIAFSGHPYVPRGMHLGIGDDSPKVRAWAMNYIRGFALLDPATDREAYETWYRQNKDRHFNDVLAASIRRVAGDLRDAVQARDTETIIQLAGFLNDMGLYLGNGESVSSAVAAAVSDTGLAETLVLALNQSNGKRELRRVVPRALRELPLEDSFFKQHIAPLLASDHPETIRLAASLLGTVRADWATELLIKELNETVAATDAARRLALWGIAGALAEIGDPRAIPAMIEVIGKDYDTVYGVGYFGLSKLTGVQYDESHNGAWWRNWWEENHDRFGMTAELRPVAHKSSTSTSDNDAEAGSHVIDGDPMARYLLFPGGNANDEEPDEGYQLLLVLPGGEGGIDFAHFVSEIADECVDNDFLVAQIIAPRWDADQFEKIVWPTRANPYPAMQFSTEDLAAKVINDIAKTHPLNKEEIYLLGWSSGGPAAYAVSLAEDLPIAGSFIAMSVFKANQLPELTAAKGRAFFILHSPDDFIPMKFPEIARKRLQAAGARVTLETYEGGHGWHGDVYGNIRRGLDWLQRRE